MHINDKKEIIAMMKTFYSSDAVFTNGSEEIFENDFNHLYSKQALIWKDMFLKTKIIF